RHSALEDGPSGGPYQSPQNGETSAVWSRPPRSPGAPLPAGAPGAGRPGRRTMGTGPGPGRRVGSVAHAADQRGRPLHACGLAGASRLARARAVQRHPGVAAGCVPHARDLPTEWTSAAYDISLATIIKIGQEPQEISCYDMSLTSPPS